MMLHSNSSLYELVCNVAVQVQKPQTCILALWHLFHQLSLLQVLCLKSLSLINMLTGNPIIIYNLLAITNLPIVNSDWNSLLFQDLKWYEFLWMCITKALRCICISGDYFIYFWFIGINTHGVLSRINVAGNTNSRNSNNSFALRFRY